MGRRKKNDGSEIIAYILMFVFAAPVVIIWWLIKFIVFIIDIVKETKYQNQLEKNMKSKVSTTNKSYIDIGIKIDELDTNTVDLIAEMIQNVEKKSKIAYINKIKTIDIATMLTEFFIDTETVKDINDFSKIYNTIYLKNKIKKHFGCNKIVIQKILEPHTLDRITYDGKIEEICKKINEYCFVKLKVTYNKSNNENIYGICDKGYLCMPYQLVFDYLVDVLTTCICITKLVFINKKAKRVKEDNEFFVILSNMSKEINDIELIAKKTKPLYQEFYKEELGNIGNDILYRYFVKLLVMRINEKEEKILCKTEEKCDNIEKLDKLMERWISDFAKNNKNVDIHPYILNQIKSTINPNNLNLFIEAINQMYKYIGLYNYNVNHSEKINMRERYINGDFSKEKEEINEEYNLNNISTGTQFELYLTELFKKLGYKTLHNGKAGDQGADLILKKGNYIYAVQAKFYTDKLSNTPIQEIVGALKYYNANQGVVITNSTFTKGAQDLAKANNVILIDGTNLKKLVDYIFEENNEEDILQKFIN